MNNLKSQLRKEYLTKLKNLDVNTKKIWDQEILKKFINSNYFKNYQVFALYWSLDHEVNTHEIIKMLLNANKKVCLPRIKHQKLFFYYINDVSQLVVDNKFNIGQPLMTNSLVNLKDIEVFVVPLIAVDKSNNRLGYGRGFYDRFLSNKVSKIRIGLAYKFQIINDKIAFWDEWDVALLSIITNN